MIYTVDFNNDTTSEHYRTFYEAHVPIIQNKQANQNGKIIIKCINSPNHTHGDKNASAFVNVSNGVYYCSVCGAYSVQRFLEDIIGLTTEEASRELSTYVAINSKIFVKDNFSKSYGHAPLALKTFAKQCSERLDPSLEIVKEYIRTRGISYETLEKFSIGYLPENKETGQLECLTMPYYYGGHVVSIRGRTLDAKKGGIAGSRLVPFNLDSIGDCDTIFICEGESDTMRLQQALDSIGYNAIAVGIPGAKFREEFKREFSGIANIYIVPQADEPSSKLAEAICKAFSSASIIQLPWKRAEIGKDICDWFTLHSDNEFIDLIPKQSIKPFSISFEELMQEAEKEYPWIIPGLLGKGDKMIIGGMQKSMKTYFTIFLVNCLVKAEALFELERFSIERSYKILLVEEEGGIITLAKRFKNILGTLDSEHSENIRIAHKTQIKLDSGTNMQKLYSELASFRPDVLILDPMQRITSVDEDSATDMAKVWDTIHALTVKYPDMAIIILQHFKKGSDALPLWDRIRGSSRSAGEADVIMGITKLTKLSPMGETQLLIELDGREVDRVLVDENTPGKMTALIDTDNWTIKPLLETDISLNDVVGNSQLILNALKKNTTLSMKSLYKVTGIKERILSKNLQELQEQGFVTQCKGRLEPDSSRIGLVWKLAEKS